VRKPTWSDEWPESWKQAYRIDEVELWGNRIDVGHTYAYQRRFAESTRQVARYLPPGSSIIDVAAGQGSFTVWLADHGYKVTWNDLRGDLEGYVRLRDDSGMVSYLPGNALELDGVGPFDAVIANEIVEHVAHPDQLMAELAGLCRPGGLLFMSTPHGGYSRSGLPTFSQVTDFSALELEQFKPGAEGHLFLLTNEELTELAHSAGLQVVEIANFTTPVLTGLRGTRRALRVVPAGAVRAANALLERTSKRLLMNTAVVLRRQ
jgi:2-polyprenyl-6-hydroxyphenyl methylase/3-demethylubiquinone-9 3-methyltransferase